PLAARHARRARALRALRLARPARAAHAHGDPAARHLSRRARRSRALNSAPCATPRSFDPTAEPPRTPSGEFALAAWRPTHDPGRHVRPTAPAAALPSSVRA